MYALLLNNKVVDVAENQFEVHESMSWVDCPDDVKIGWIIENGQFVDPLYRSQEEIAAFELRSLRSERDRKLKESDWTQLADVALTDTKKTEWSNYRQALRDITESFQSVNDEGFAWPTEPSA